MPLAYHWRNLFARKFTTLLTVLVIAAVVGTLTWILGFVVALRDSLAVASDPAKVIVLQRGALSETNSSISPEEFNRLSQLDDVETVSPELYWQTQLPRFRDAGVTRANVALRGVTDAAFKVHRNVRLLGASFSTGSPEVIAGAGAARQFRGLAVGDTLKLGFGENRDFKVVGHFSADGGPMDSEIWMYLPAMQSAYGRGSYSSAALRLKPGADAAATIERVGGSAIQLAGQREATYWQEQSKNVRIYQTVCTILVSMMALAAVFSIANTMFSMVAGRGREIAMLRTIGFSRGQILRGFVVEAVFLALLGGVAGCAGCAVWLALTGSAKDMFGANTFTTMAFDVRITPMIVGLALTSVAIVGALGALFPAYRASRTPVVQALREA
jgi:putative ABC transport system permease protein